MQQTNSTAATPRLVNERFASEYLDLSIPYLRLLRSKNAPTDGPAFCRFGRSVRYDIADLDHFIELHKVGE